MGMPKASMYKDRDLVSAKDDIGFAGQIAGVQPVSQSACMKLPTQPQLGGRVFGWHPSHCLGSRERHRQYQVRRIGVGLDWRIKLPSRVMLVARVVSVPL